MAKLTFVVCFSICLSSMMAEPQCSPFHYHEQLLEKMVDVQHKMGIYSEKMEKWESAIDEKLSKLEDKMEKQAQLEKKLTASVNDKMEQQAQLEKKLTATVNDTLAEASEFKVNLRKELLDLQAAARTPVILFKAKNSRSDSVSSGDTIVFQEIVQNEGEGYNKNTGIFTAPVTGTYLFTVQICLYSNKRLSVSIVANGTAITAGYFGDQDWGAICYSTDGQAFIQAEEQVKVLVTYAYSGSVIFSDYKNQYWTFFSGVLLH